MADKNDLAMFDLQVTSMLPAKSFNIVFEDDGLGGHVEFPVGAILLFLIYKLPRYFIPGFESFGLFVHKKKLKIDFQYGRHVSHLWFLIKTNLTIFICKLFRYFLPSFESTGLSVDKKIEIDFRSEHF